MGTETFQIKQHIQEERERLDMNITKLELEFSSTAELVKEGCSNPSRLLTLALSTIVFISKLARSRTTVPPHEVQRPAA